MPSTLLAYMDDQEKCRDQATVQAVTPNAKDNLASVVLDRTIFYPQGGGQACDAGTMTNPAGTFSVQEVRFIDGLVHHYGTFAQGAFSPGDKVECIVDSERRQLNSRLHSAGHLLDEAVKNMGLAWTPTKGIHYPGQAAVEYSGRLDDPEGTKAKLQIEIDRLAQAGCPIVTKLVNVADLPQLTDYIPPNLPEDKPVRVVTMGGAKSTPCGGTHVPTTAAIGSIVVRYIKAKKGSIKVAYDVEATRT